jgi:hypothetical protein
MRIGKKVKIFTFMLVAMVMAAASFSPAHAAKVHDIDKHWAKNQINSFIDNGYATGYADGTFRPEGRITRAEFMAFVNRSFDFNVLGYVDFNDVKATDWYYSDIRKATYIGYVTGYLDGSVKPNANITRQEAAVILTRLLGLTEDTTGANYNDYYNMDSWSRGHIGAVSRMGIMGGYSDKTFRPKEYLTRAECIVILLRALDYKEEEIQDVYVTSASYGENSTTKVTGDLYVNYNGNVSLKNLEVKGDIIIQSRIGTNTVSMSGVSCAGTVFASFGNILLDNCGINSLQAANSGSTITARGNTSVSSVAVTESVSLVHNSLNSAYTGFSNIVLKGNRTGVTLNLTGTFDSVTATNSSQIINLISGRIAELYVTGQSNSIVLAPDTTVTNATLNNRCTVLGAGTIARAAVNSANVTLQREPMTARTGSYTPAFTGDSTVTLTVRSSVDSSAVKGAVVKLTGLFDQQTTDTNGRVIFYNVPRTAVDYTITCTNYTEATGYFTPNASTFSTYLPISPTGKYTATITVKDSAGVIPGAAVVLTSPTTQSVTANASGVAVFTALNPGAHRYYVSYNGYVTASDKPFTITSANYSETVTLLPTKLTVKARPTNGAFLTNFEISINGGAYQKVTSGSYSITKLAYNSTCTVKIKVEGYLETSKTVVINSSDTNLEVSLNPNETYSYPITVIADSTGSPISGANVELSNDGGTYSVKTNTQGVAELKGIPKGSYTATVTASGYVDYKQNINVTADISKNSGIVRMISTRSISISIKNISGSAIADANVVLREAKEGGKEYPAVKSNSSGVASLTGIPDGVYNMIISHTKYEESIQTITVSSGVVSFNVVLSGKSYGITLNVYDKDAQPVSSGISVKIKSGITEYDAATNESGAVTFSVPEGTYTIEITNMTVVPGTITVDAASSYSISITPVAAPVTP